MSSNRSVGISSLLMQEMRIANPRGWLVAIVVAIVVAVILLAGLLKAADVVAFAEALNTWGWIPVPIVGALAIAIPTAEIGLGIAWIIGFDRSRVTRLILAMLVAFSAVYIIQIAIVGPPNCGCLGLISRYFSFRYEAILVIVRNAVLMVILIASLWRER